MATATAAATAAAMAVATVTIGGSNGDRDSSRGVLMGAIHVYRHLFAVVLKISRVRRLVWGHRKNHPPFFVVILKM